MEGGRGVQGGYRTFCSKSLLLSVYQYEDMYNNV